MNKEIFPLQIAIDGPVAAGKGDIAAGLAKELHLLNINTGAMYRMLALACIDRGIDRKNESAVVEVLDSIDIDLEPPHLGSKYTYRGLIDGKDVTERLLDPDVSQGSSDVAVLPSIRKRMVDLQRKMAVGKQVVMEGRDIALRVLPGSQLKIYLTATLEERARRRWEQWKQKGITKSLKEVIEEVRIRDKQDMGRVTDPLQKLPDAWELESTNLSEEEVVKKIVNELKRRSLI